MPGIGGTVPSPVVGTETTMVFRLTAVQQRRVRLGLAGGAVIVWALGVVRLVVTGRFLTTDSVAPTAVLTVALVIAVIAADRVKRVVLLTDDALHTRWGPWRRTMAWTDIEAVDRRDRGVARRVVVRAGGRTRVLPVPLTGGSILGPGRDPGLDEKLELIRRWWAEHRGS